MKLGKIIGALALILLLAVVGGVIFLRVTGGSLTNPFSPPVPEAAVVLAEYRAPEGEASSPEGQTLLRAALETRRPPERERHGAGRGKARRGAQRGAARGDGGEGRGGDAGGGDL